MIPLKAGLLFDKFIKSGNVPYSRSFGIRSAMIDDHRQEQPICFTCPCCGRHGCEDRYMDIMIHPKGWLPTGMGGVGR